jgi:hypothetical protein
MQDAAGATSSSDALISVGAQEIKATDVFAASLKLTYFEFVLACVGISQVAITKDQPPLAKVQTLAPKMLDTMQCSSSGQHLPEHTLTLSCQPLLSLSKLWTSLSKSGMHNKA